MSRGIPFAPWREVWIRRHLTVDSRKFARMQCQRQPRWRWHLFQAALWVAWRARMRWATRLAGLVCAAGFMGWDHPDSWWPVEWPKWMKRKKEVPW